MKVKSIHVPLMFVVMMFFFVACNEEETPIPPIFVQPEVEGVNNGVVSQPPVDPVGEPEEAPVVEASPEVESGVADSTDDNTVSVAQSEGTTVVLSVGSTVQHKVQVGEWLMQIARCYGADYRAVRQANPNVIYPDFIMPGSTVAVPNVGSVGEIGGTPCVGEYTIVAGDTWIGLAERFGTTAVILQRVNPGSLLAGDKIFVPAHGKTPIVVTPVVDPEILIPEPTRIMFAAGETAVTLGGNVAANSETRYVFAARAGQEFKITLAPSQNDVTFSIINPADAGQPLPAEGVLPVTGDYIIRVTGGAVDAAFSLALSIVDAQSGGGITLPEAQRINFAPGATSAIVSGSVAAGQMTYYVFTAAEGQKLTLNFTPSDASVTYLVTPPGLGNVMPEDNILPTTGDYFLVVIGGGGDATFSFTLMITSP
ncbi:MAG: hypothetical protein DHS20C20_20850 [Ardenticatenaceae bacterium]|nr:MAG: hypothetical protein DHS20C20_20850 [Ardenticatenaceae bacterium]